MKNKEEEYKLTLKKVWIHFKTIVKHRHYVLIYCSKCGIFWQGLVHDLSKFSSTEFWNNAKYTIEGKSPVTLQLEKIGYSFSWQHHKGRNPHHYVFWIDKVDDGGYIHRMPYKYTIEMLCDYLGASKAYDKATSYDAELKWWSKKRIEQNMHPDNRTFLDIMFGILAIIENGREGYDEIPERTFIGIYLDYLQRNNISPFDKKFLEDLYSDIVEHSTFPECCKIRQPVEKTEDDIIIEALADAGKYYYEYKDQGLSKEESLECLRMNHQDILDKFEKYGIRVERLPPICFD